MFLEVLARRNPELIAAAVELHQSGHIPASSYVIDLDAVKDNAHVLAAEARRHRLSVFVMTKQFGRNPRVMEAARDGGLGSFVALDMVGARAIHTSGHHLAHIGHLVQVPRAEAIEAAMMTPDYWTVFSLDKANEASSATSPGEGIQKVLGRVYGADEESHEAWSGEFAEHDIAAVAESIDSLSRVRFSGITVYPALTFDKRTGYVQATSHLATLERSVERLCQVGMQRVEANAPGHTSAAVFALLAERGVTQVEPGHGLTGTTPLHVAEDLPERPAMLYLTEISHTHGSRAYCFGGGFYVCLGSTDHSVRAMVGHDVRDVLRSRCAAELPPPEAVDFYATIHIPPERTARSGDSAIFGFRAQAFVTRAFVVPISGVSTNAPHVAGIWTTDGRHVANRLAPNKEPNNLNYGPRGQLTEDR